MLSYFKMISTFFFIFSKQHGVSLIMIVSVGVYLFVCFSDKLEQGGVPCDTVPPTEHHRRLLDHDPLL